MDTMSFAEAVFGLVFETIFIVLVAKYLIRYTAKTFADEFYKRNHQDRQD